MILTKIFLELEKGYKPFHCLGTCSDPGRMISLMIYTICVFQGRHIPLLYDLHDLRIMLPGEPKVWMI